MTSARRGLVRHFASGVEPEARKSVELRQDSARNYPERRDLSGLPARRVDCKNPESESELFQVIPGSERGHCLDFPGFTVYEKV